MINTGSEDASNDTTKISGLFNSLDTVQAPSGSATNGVFKNTPIQQKPDLKIVSNSLDMPSTLCNATKQNLIVSLQKNYNLEGAISFNSHQFAGVENKMHIRHVHIPYILNGELYQIQTQDGENVTVKCCHCPPDRVYRGSVRSTGNFHMHIKRRHPELLEKLHNMKVNALLERRDRLMRNRKISSRSMRNRLSNSNNFNLNDMRSLKEEGKQELASTTPTALNSVSDSDIIHTHKLKIKTVFQRHQMQQREAEEMRNWNNSGYVVMPMGKIPADNDAEQPINFSLKPYNTNNNEIVDALSPNTYNSRHQIEEFTEERSPQNTTTQNSPETVANSSKQQTNLSNCNEKRNETICESHSTLLTSSPISYPSANSSFASDHQYEVEASQLYDCYSFQQQNVSVIKPEQMILGSESSEAIDLTMQTDSGIFSSSEDPDFENNNKQLNRNEAIPGSREKLATTHTAKTDRCVNDVENNNNINALKWHELLVQFKNSLRDIQREINVRNQIESNRMFLDFAKFKFLNPGFQFNW